MAPTMLVLVFLLAVAVSAALSLGVRRVAAAHGAVVPARPDRWHRQPTPTFGGVAIAATTLGLAMATLVASYVQPVWIKGLLVMGSAGGLFIVGLVDDRLQLTPLAKLAATLAIGSFLLYGLSLASETVLPWWQTILLVIWYAGLVHAFNLLDNMDGLAGGVALVATAMLALVFGADLGAPMVGVLAAFAGSIGGFLVWNVRPARLFMGDCGSLFLGAMVAGTALVLLTRPGAAFALDGFVICLVLIVPLLDTSFVLVLRRLAGREATRGGTDHLSHRLVSLGFSERRAVSALYLLGLAGGATAWFAYGDGMSRLPAAALFVVAVLLGGVHLARVPVYDGEDFRALQKASFAPFLRDLTFRWHALEMLLDIVLISVVYYLSWRIRFEGQQLNVFLPSFRASLPIVLGCKLLALYMSGAYERMWGSFGIRDLFATVRGVVLGSIASILVVAYVYRFERFSRAVFIIDGALLTLAILAARGSFRMMGEAATTRNSHARRGLIYGAGSGGQLLVREMRANAEWGLTPIAFLDDDPTKLGRRLMGVPIRGGADRIDRVLARYRIDEVVISTSKIDPEREEQIHAACARRGIPVRQFKLEIT
jgi:UDP-GlcNAc:undecaprenyl-phosphate GlcNAc-1-phosphate transferase